MSKDNINSKRQPQNRMDRKRYDTTSFGASECLVCKLNTDQKIMTINTSLQTELSIMLGKKYGSMKVIFNSAAPRMSKM